MSKPDCESEQHYKVNLRLTANFALATLSKTFGDETEPVLREMLEILNEQKPKSLRIVSRDGNLPTKSR